MDIDASVPPRLVIETDLNQIIQTSNGEVEIRFDSEQTARISTSRNSTESSSKRITKPESEVQGIKISDSATNI